jgi:NAD(P)-dependent dehydrogenase (short-subunit alcohol dehydrogenase family)
MGALEGRIAVITGAGNGIGRAYALRFASEGAKVVVNSVQPGADGTDATSSAGLVAHEIRAAGGEAEVHVGSVSEWNEGKRLIDLAVESYGRVDVLVNNAGFLRDKMIVNMTEDDWDAVLAVHLKGQFVPLRFAGEHWRARSKAGEAFHASVINTTAGAGLHGNVGQGNYGSAKAGAAALTVIAAREMQRFGVHVNAISPLARTRQLETVAALADTIRKPEDPALFDQFDPDNIAPLAVHLASQDCRVTGQVFNVFAGTIGLYQGWHVVERFERSRRWTVEEIAAALGHLPTDPPPFDPS